MCDGRIFTPLNQFLSAAKRSVRTVSVPRPAQMSTHQPQWARSRTHGVSLFIALLDGCETSLLRPKQSRKSAIMAYYASMS